MTRAYLERAAMAYLERYSSSAENLRRVLARKVMKRCRLRDEDPGEVLPLVEEVVARAVSGGYVNDQAYAEGRVASLRRRGGSTRAIGAKLAQKGVGRDTIEAALEGDPGDDEAAARAHARRRRLGPFRPGGRAAHRERDLAVLARAGFSYGIAKAVIDGEEEPE